MKYNLVAQMKYKLVAQMKYKLEAQMKDWIFKNLHKCNAPDLITIKKT